MHHKHNLEVYKYFDPHIIALNCLLFNLSSAISYLFFFFFGIVFYPVAFSQLFPCLWHKLIPRWQIISVRIWEKEHNSEITIICYFIHTYFFKKYPDRMKMLITFTVKEELKYFVPLTSGVILFFLCGLYRI